MKNFPTILSYLLIGAAVIIIIVVFSSNMNQPASKNFSDFRNSYISDNVKEVEIIIGQNSITWTDNNDKKYTTIVDPAYVDQVINNPDIASKVTTTITFQNQSNFWQLLSFLPSLILLVLTVAIIFIFLQQSQSGTKGAMNFGRSRARLVSPDNKKVTFQDVAGADEEKFELQEIVQFLRSPIKYVEMGARIPKGVLLVGPPGTGKTLLAKAVAGEAGVPFYTISGSDFVEMYVGVGASRVRDLFDQAKRNVPCVIFIDEIDAVGRHRGAGLGGGHDEREQTLNQLLVEMDGFGVNEGVIIIAATNRPDILDPALLRPGRFDRQITVMYPDVKGREEILKVHSRNKPLADNVSLKVLAKRTPGFTGADLENVLNESALIAVRNNRKFITMAELEEAITRVMAGPEKRSRVISDKDRTLTAYHEAGHAVLHKYLPTADPIHEITIVPRGMAGGYTMALPEDDKMYITKTKLEEEMVTLLGGRVAEKLVLDDISTGASNDIERTTSIARKMVTEWGMSDEIGTVSFHKSSDDEVFLGRDYGKPKNFSEETAAIVDKEVKRLIDEAFYRAEKLLSTHIEKLHAVANALLEKEKLTGEEFDEIMAMA